MRFAYGIYLFLALITFVSWLNYWLLARRFPVWRTRLVRFAYLALTAATVLFMLISWPRSPVPAQAGPDPYQFLVYATLIWLAGQLILAAMQPLLYLACRLLKDKPAAGTPPAGTAPAITRRAFLGNALAAAPLAAFAISGAGVYGAQHDLAVVRHSLVMPDLPAALDGFRIGQVSDTHVGPYFDLERLDAVIDKLTREKPDLVVVTGDFADDMRQLRPAVARLTALQAAVPHGVYFCWGNHEYFRDIALIRAELRAGGIKILENTAALILPGSRPLYLLGVDYPQSETGRRGLNVDAGRRREFFAAADRGVPPEAFKLLIAHHPDFLIDGFSGRIPLTLTGHTHGGQVVIAGRSLINLHAYVRGLYRENGVYGYVSSGAGHWFPFRYGCPPEISIFTLRA